MTEMYFVDCKVKINGSIKLLQELHTDIICGFAENVLPELLVVGINRAKKLSKEINSSKTKLKRYEESLNKFYKTNYKVIEVYAGVTGYLWNYNTQEYYYPQ